MSATVQRWPMVGGSQRQGELEVLHFSKIWDHVWAVCQSLGIPVFLLFENVAPRDKDNVSAITSSLSVGLPTLVDAAYTGWHRRARLL